VSICELCWKSEGIITIDMGRLPDAMVCEQCEAELEEVKRPAIRKIANMLGWLSKKKQKSN